MAHGGSHFLAVVVVGARALLGIMLVSMPAFAHPWTKRVTGNNTVAVGHFGTAGYIVSRATGQVVGKKSRSIGEMNLPLRAAPARLDGGLPPCRWSLIYHDHGHHLPRQGRGSRGVQGSALHTDGGARSATPATYLMAALGQGLQFGIAVAVILLGVRTILGELSSHRLPGHHRAEGRARRHPGPGRADRLPVYAQRRARRLLPARSSAAWSAWGCSSRSSKPAFGTACCLVRTSSPVVKRASATRPAAGGSGHRLVPERRPDHLPARVPASRRPRLVRVGQHDVR